ncbi:MAG TPA: nuclear transport factor 2 family protein [Acidimicrobiales bacterium]|nr:nuclear transport factor 2 family protein [Acidimicrobiales bacterium]
MPAPPVPERWAEEAVEWFQAWDEAARLGIPNLLRFVAPDVVHDDQSVVHVAAVGRAEYGSHLQREHRRAIDQAPTADVYLDVTGALVERREPTYPSGDMRAVELDDHGMVTRENETDNAELGVVFDDPDAIAVQALADTYLRAWSSSDPDAIRALYSPDADLVDSLQRLEVTSADAIVDYARDPTSTGMSLDWREGGPVGEAMHQAVFFRWLHDPWGRPAGSEAFVLYTGDDGSGCPGDAAVALQVSDGLIVRERRYHEIDSVRRCWNTDQLPDGWWTGLEPPAAHEDVVTGTVGVAGQRIEIHNGTATLERLVQWAMGRFETARLPAPPVASVAFDQDTTAPQCAVDRTGLTIDLGESSQVFVCLGEDDACAGEACTAFVANARLLVLHELAHAWMYRQVDEATQQAFMDHMGLEAWSSAEVGWYDRGVEQAAQVLAWGLMDEPIPTTRLGDLPCEQLVEAFRLLTGDHPLLDACA